jgi:hypothetical protein
MIGVDCPLFSPRARRHQPLAYRTACLNADRALIYGYVGRLSRKMAFPSYDAGSPRSSARDRIIRQELSSGGKQLSTRQEELSHLWG